MTPDELESIRQIDVHAKLLRTDLESVRAAHPESSLIVSCIELFEVAIQGVKLGIRMSSEARGTHKHGDPQTVDEQGHYLKQSGRASASRSVDSDAPGELSDLRARKPGNS